MIQDHDDGNASFKVLVVNEDVVVLAHVKDQSWKLEIYFKGTVSLYFVKRAKLLICMAVKIARASKALSRDALRKAAR
jgi:hypothetical protein